MKKSFLVLMLIVMVAGIAQANLLRNPGFEEGTFAATNTADFWTLSSASYTSQAIWQANGGVLDWQGTKALQMNGFPSGYDNYISQDVAGLEFGYEYSFSVWAKSPTQGAAAEVAMWMGWYNAAGDLIDDNEDFVTLGTVAGDDWAHFDFGTLVAPAGTVSGKFWLHGDKDNITNGSGGVIYDDVHMSGVVPEPVTICLLGLGGLMLRKRKA